MKPGLISKAWQVLLLTQLQLVGSFVITLGIFFIEFGAIIFQNLESGSQLRPGETGKTVSQYVLGFLRYISGLPHADSIITGLFWMIVAIAIYFAYVAISNILISIRNEIVVDVSYSKGSVAKLLITRFGSKILAVCAFSALCAASVLLFVPFWMDMLSVFVVSGFQLIHITFLLVGFFGLFLNIYAVWAAGYFTWIYEESV